MRKQDIIITTPEHSTIYAYGTVPESHDSPWGDLGDYHARTYRPAYVLEVRDSGFATILVARHHPDHPHHLWAAERGQASLLDASEYTLADYNERNEFMRLHSHSHWATAEEKDVYLDGLNKLKPIPRDWAIITQRTTYVRMLWAEYETRLTTAIATRRAAEAEADRRKRAARKLQKEVVERVKALGIQQEKGETNVAAYDSSRILIGASVLARLVEVYENTLIDEVSR